MNRKSYSYFIIIIVVIILFDRAVMGLRVDAVRFDQASWWVRFITILPIINSWEKRFIIHSWTLNNWTCLASLFSFDHLFLRNVFLLLYYFSFSRFFVWYFIVIFCWSCCCFHLCICYISSSICGDKPPSFRSSIHSCGPFSIRIKYILHILACLYCAN